MTLNTLKCNHLTSLCLKGLILRNSDKIWRSSGQTSRLRYAMDEHNVEIAAKAAYRISHRGHTTSCFLYINMTSIIMTQLGNILIE